MADNIATLPVEGPGQGDDEMGEPAVPSTAVPTALHEQNLGRIAGAGASAHEHMVMYGKILDYAYEADRKMVSLVESLGVRESTSRSGHLGIPIGGSGAAPGTPGSTG